MSMLSYRFQCFHVKEIHLSFSSLNYKRWLTYQAVSESISLLVPTETVVHLFPFRTQKLSPSSPMVLQSSLCGRVGRCQCRNYTSSIKKGPARVLFLCLRSLREFICSYLRLTLFAKSEKMHPQYKRWLTHRAVSESISLLVPTETVVHLFPFRTQKLSPSSPMVLQSSLCGRVGRCQYRNYTSSIKKGPARVLFFMPSF